MHDSILLVCRNRAAALGAMHTLGKAGCSVDIIVGSSREGASLLLSESRYARKVVEVVSARREDCCDEGLFKSLVEYAADRIGGGILLVPCDRYAYRVIENYRAELTQSYKIPPFCEDRERRALFSKDALLDIAVKNDVPIRGKWLFSLENYDEMIEEVVYPCYCKPVVREPDLGREGKNCECEEALRTHLETLARSKSDRDVFVLESAHYEYEISLYSFCANDDVRICGGTVKSLSSGSSGSEDLVVEVLDASGFGVLNEYAEKMLKTLNLVGVCSVVFLSAGSGVVFKEIIPLVSLYELAFEQCGASPLRLFTDFVLRESKPVSFDAGFFHEKAINEITAWSRYGKGEISKRDVHKVLAASTVKLIGGVGDSRVSSIFRGEVLAKRAKGMKCRFERRFKHRIKTLLRKPYHAILGYPQTKKENLRESGVGKPRVIVVGRVYGSNLCMAKSLGEAGYDVEILRVFIRRPRHRNRMKALRPDAYSRYVKNFRICVSGRKRKRVAKALLKMADPEYRMLVIPVDDFAAGAIDKYYGVLSEHFILPNVREEQNGVYRLMNKEIQKDLARAAGLPVVNCCSIKSEQGKFSIPEDVNYPCFIKPTTSESGYKTRMRRCDSREELRAVLESYASKKDIDMLVEDYIEIGRECSFLGLSTRDGVLCPGFFAAEVGGSAEHRGVALLGRVLPASQQEALINDISNFIVSLGYEGLFDVDLIESTEGRMYFVELNLRFGGSGYAITRSGLNLPGIYADYKLKGKPIDFEAKVENTGGLFINEKILLDEYVGGRISGKEAKTLLRRADIFFIKDETDLASWKHFRRVAPIAVVARMMRAHRDKN